MVYAEYFRKGTQPSGVCPVHPEPTYVDTLAGGVGTDTGRPVSPDQADSTPAVVPAGTSGTSLPEPSAPQVTPAAAPEKAAAEAEPGPKRRGFWSRLFGRDGDDKKKKETPPPPKKKPDGR
jgi:hypothetical protein